MNPGLPVRDSDAAGVGGHEGAHVRQVGDERDGLEVHGLPGHGGTRHDGHPPTIHRDQGSKDDDCRYILCSLSFIEPQGASHGEQPPPPFQAD
jgi:hypothetical protein